MGEFRIVFQNEPVDVSEEFSIATSFRLSLGEKLFGGGESFTRLDKRGQKLGPMNFGLLGWDLWALAVRALCYWGME